MTFLLLLRKMVTSFGSQIIYVYRVLTLKFVPSLFSFDHGQMSLPSLFHSYQEETRKAGVYVCWCVQSLVTLEQGGGISLNVLEAQLEALLESVVTFNPPGELLSPKPSSAPLLSVIKITSFSSCNCFRKFLC